jgi:hypothetical protein
VHPRLLGGDVAELVEDTADHLIGTALPTQHFELRHHAVEGELDTGEGMSRVAVTLAVQLMVTALEFFAIELREQGHMKQGVHSVSVVSGRHRPL